MAQPLPITVATTAVRDSEGDLSKFRDLPPVAAIKGLTLATLDPLPLEQTPTAFLQMVSDHLGDLGDSNDGFDHVLADSYTDIEPDSAAVATLEEHDTAADFTPGDFARITTDPIGADIVSFIQAGDILAGESDPIITPTDGGGGGGGGGGGTDDGIQPGDLVGHFLDLGGGVFGEDELA